MEAKARFEEEEVVHSKRKERWGWALASFSVQLTFEPTVMSIN